MVRPSRQYERKDLSARPRLLVFNCHEPWVYQLHTLGMHMDIVDELSDRYPAPWDSRLRPVPSRARRICREEALAQQTSYHCIIAHTITNLLEVRTRPEPRILVLHRTREACQVVEQRAVEASAYQEMLHGYVHHTQTHVVAVSQRTGDSWGFPDRVVMAGVDATDYAPHSGHRACGVCVCPLVTHRLDNSLWSFHRNAFTGLPLRAVGHHPEWPDATPARNWKHLRDILRDHRFYVHLADPEREDGFNMALLEAMAAGLPILGNRHPISPVQHGISGFLADDPVVLRAHAQRLLAHPELAYRMGQAARQRVLAGFPLHKFRTDMLCEITAARMLRSTVSPSNAWPPSPVQTTELDLCPVDEVPASMV